ncbi:MAG: hypothetical protein IJQ71_03785 [Clostridia bacterium]|nr:hypothetical protein [Clostridia bacterium]
MFGSNNKNYEMQIEHLKESLNNVTEEKKKVENELEKYKARISELEEKLAQTDLEVLKKETQETLAEYQGLKELYLRKNQEFDGNLQAKEESYAKEESLARHHLKEEIVQQKQDTEKIVSDTVNTFSETYNYYLNQIKVLMDALGNVASATGKQLFSGEAVDLKTKFGRQMVNALKQETDTLPQGSGDRILIGTSEEEAAAAEAEAAAAKAKAAKKTAKKPAAKKPAAKKKTTAKATGAKKSTAAKAAGKTTTRTRKPKAAAAGTAAAGSAEAGSTVEKAAEETPVIAEAVVGSVTEQAAAAAEDLSAKVTEEVKEVTEEVKETVDGATVSIR